MTFAKALPMQIFSSSLVHCVCTTNLNFMLSQVSVATKVNPWGSDGLTRTSVLEQVATSLKSLQTECIDLLYLHAPDHNTPIEVTLGAIQEVYQGYLVYKHKNIS